MKNYLLTFNQDWADEHDVPALAVMSEMELEEWKKVKLSINAWLGNGGDDFCENWQGKTGKWMIAAGIVEVYEVDATFVEVFNKANLASLSLCNIFDGEPYDYDESEEE